MLNALILRPLNVPRAQSIYGIEHGSDYGYQSYPDYLDLRDRNRSFDSLALVWQLLPQLRQGSTSAKTHPVSSAIKRAGTTSTH
jgi:hypothetical protein